MRSVWHTLTIVLGLFPLIRSQSCLSELENLAANSPLEVEKLFYHSGKDLNDLGKYHECNSLPIARYYLIQFNYEFATVVLGICVPKFCSEKDIEGNLKHILEYYKISKRLDPQLIEVTDPEKYNSRSFSTSAILMVVLMCSIIGLCILGSILDYSSRKNPEKKNSRIVSVLLCFSLITNFEKLLSFPESHDNLQIFNGIRVIGMVWISLGHTYVYTFTGPISNPLRAFDILRSFKHKPIGFGLYIVDIFFLISGFLISYLVIAELKKRKGKMNWPLFFLHRLLRICPIFYTVYLFYLVIFPYIGTGPAWPSLEYRFRDVCEKDWWSVFLFISNFIPSGKPACMSWGWFIANDMQFYLLSPIVLILQYKHKLLGYGALSALILTNFLVVLIESTKNGYNPGIIYGNLNNEQFSNAYIKPYYRMGPYLVGMFFGFFYREYQTEMEEVKKEKTSEIELEDLNESSLASPLRPKLKSRILYLEVYLVKWIHIRALRLCAYALGVLIMASALYIPYNFEYNGPDSWTAGQKSLYLASEHLIVAIGLVIILLPIIAGYGKPALLFLSNKYFAVVAKISFSYYLVHPLWIHYYSNNRHQATYIEDGDILYHFGGTCLYTTISATLLTLMVESPILMLEKKLFKKG